MKIAVFSNLWPPVFVGGYEIGAFNVVRELRRRGHEVLVISAHDYHLFTAGGTYERGKGCGCPDSVDAGLCLFGSLWEWAKRRHVLVLKDVLGTMVARHGYRKALRDFRPDCLLAFSPRGILAPVLDDFVAHARGSGVPVYCYVSDPWLADWPGTHPLWPKLTSLSQSLRVTFRCTALLAYHLLRAAGLVPDSSPRLDHFFYCSDYVRRLSAARAGGAASNVVAPWGLSDVHHGIARPPRHFRGEQPLTLLYAGQILAHKGLPVLIRALALCNARHRLVVVGDDRGEFAAECKALAGRLGVLERIEFLGKKRPDEMSGLLARAGHILVVPSVWEEPFSIVVLEGMAVGLPVIASDTGGTAEILQHGRNGFLFPRSDSFALAAILDQLEEDRELCYRVGDCARDCIARHYTIERMVDQIEAGLCGSFTFLPLAAA